MNRFKFVALVSLEIFGLALVVGLAGVFGLGFDAFQATVFGLLVYCAFHCGLIEYEQREHVKELSALNTQLMRSLHDMMEKMDMVAESEEERHWRQMRDEMANVTPLRAEAKRK